MKNPSADRGPKPNRPIAQPQAMMIIGVRQVERREAALKSPVVADMQDPLLFDSTGDPRPVRRS
jgi:hypothetical protein